MLSEQVLNVLNSGEFDLATVHGKKADWNAEKEQFENIEGNTVSWGHEPGSELEDRHVKLYQEIDTSE